MLLNFDSSITIRSQLTASGLQSILDLNGLTEVAVNQPFEVWFDRGNGWENLSLPNLSFDLCLDLAKSLAVYAGLSIPIGEDNPVASVILPDGERGQIAVPPATEKNIVSMTFRKPSLNRFTLSDYQNSGRFDQYSDLRMDDVTLTELQRHLLDLKAKGDMQGFFDAAVKANQNILLVGGTGSGKTTVMKALVDCYPTSKRLFTIEDVHELDLPNHPNHLHLFYKQGGIRPKALIESCMRMKPDHVMLAELRGDEAWTYLEMLNTGHEGSITTIHANNCRSAPARLAGLIKQSEVGQTLDIQHILRTINSSIDVIAFFKHTHLTELYFDPHYKNQLLSH
ncbi:P-type DNA transfer ATPase VirB11 [Vibrio sp. SS-MA-C1-2]|uniref:P-type DNA transfer ATPase VirB11 n=1 Tax=Vibrio sp. SS-MA-C1-2 TaxID=2908646 RepID=UPI001F3D326E|nr:P-type DNA transfer ATPase VirB11 [Vibrio sp. SS-MA-C1-2]UJF17246.1 P-type DNA transfer ATPase VirB11 [Vibrio sp. SS-MA-C1-2]